MEDEPSPLAWMALFIIVLFVLGTASWFLGIVF